MADTWLSRTWCSNSSSCNQRRRATHTSLAVLVQPLKQPQINESSITVSLESMTPPPADWEGMMMMMTAALPPPPRRPHRPPHRRVVVISENRIHFGQPQDILQWQSVQKLVLLSSATHPFAECKKRCYLPKYSLSLVSSRQMDSFPTFLVSKAKQNWC